MTALATVLRVARVRERAARANLAAATRAEREASERAEMARTALADAAQLPLAVGLDGGQLLAWQASATRRADEALARGREAAAAGRARSEAQTVWQDARGRRELLAELLARWQADRALRVEAAVQRDIDDLAARRREEP